MQRSAHVERECENKLRALRKKRGMSETDMTKLIEKKSVNTYSYKERGKTAFNPYEMARIGDALEMDFATFNDIFFDGELRICGINKD